MDKTITLGDIMELLASGDATGGENVIGVRAEKDFLSGAVNSKLWAPLKRLTVTGLNTRMGGLEVIVSDDE